MSKDLSTSPAISSGHSWAIESRCFTGIIFSYKASTRQAKSSEQVQFFKIPDGRFSLPLTRIYVAASLQAGRVSRPEGSRAGLRVQPCVERYYAPNSASRPDFVLHQEKACLAIASDQALLRKVAKTAAALNQQRCAPTEHGSALSFE